MHTNSRATNTRTHSRADRPAVAFGDGERTMPDPLQFAAFLGPSALIAYVMIEGRALSLNQFRRVSRKPITLKEWNIVYQYLNLPLENQKELARPRRKRPTRLITAGALVPMSAALFLLPLPFVATFTFAQYTFDLFPVIKSLVSGAILAASLLLTFYRPRRWLLSQAVLGEYPFRPWKELTKVLEKK
jgi:hypothetical protein